MSAPPSTFRGLRDSLRSFVPIWLQNRPALQVGYKILYAWALILDVLLKWAVEGVYCWFPGFSLNAGPNQVDAASTALPFSSADPRNILQGPGESNESYAARLVAWRQDWEAAGSAEILAQQIQSFLVGAGTLGAGVLPIVRVVDRAGQNWGHGERGWHDDEGDSRLELGRGDWMGR